MTRSTEQMTTCPHCSHATLYRLGDGRFKCGACRKKFSLANRRSRLASAAMEEIVDGFAAGSPALSVATATGLNPKTVQLYYGRIRELLAADREQCLAGRYGSATVPPALFAGAVAATGWRDAVPVGCLVAHDAEMELLLISDDGAAAPARFEPPALAGWLVAADRRAMEGLQLERINCLPMGDAREKARDFWTSAKRRLAAYCGGFRQHFHLYLREMEFRENMASRPAARDHIGALLARNTITVTGENDA